MALNDQDFKNAVDFTAFGVWSGALLNQSFTGLLPNPDNASALSGIGFNITTVDSALNVPVVPNATQAGGTYSKWKRYCWKRIPHASAGVTARAISYVWNDNATNDATFRKWLPDSPDLTALQAQANTSTAGVITAINTANGASANAATALTNANTALTTANNANNAIAGATAASTAATTAATTAINTATAANTTAGAANANAASALAAATAARTIGNLTPGAPGTRIRSAYGTVIALEYYSTRDTITTIAERQAAGTDGAAFASNALPNAVVWTIRSLNTTLADPGGNITSLAANVLTMNSGVYRITGRVMAAGTTTSIVHTCRWFNITDNVAENRVFGTSMKENTVAQQCVSSIEGVFSTDGTKSYRLETWALTPATNAAFGGKACGTGSSAETYTIITLEKIG